MDADRYKACGENVNWCEIPKGYKGKYQGENYYTIATVVIDIKRYFDILRKIFFIIINHLPTRNTMDTQKKYDMTVNFTAIADSIDIAQLK